jgi:hypothetical protein
VPKFLSGRIQCEKAGGFKKGVKYMPPIIGNAIVIAVLCVVIFFAGRSFITTIKKEISGKGCSGCSGNCSCSKCNNSYGVE